MSEKTMGWLIIICLVLLVAFFSIIGSMISNYWIKKADKEDDNNQKV